MLLCFVPPRSPAALWIVLPEPLGQETHHRTARLRSLRTQHGHRAPAPISDPPGSRLRDSARAVISAGPHAEDRSRPYLSVVRDPSQESHLQRRPQTLPVPPNLLRRSRAPRHRGPAARPHLRVPRAVQQLRTVPRDFSEPAAADPDPCNSLLRPKPSDRDPTVPI